MTDLDRRHALDPVHAGDDAIQPRTWADWLVIFLRTMAVLSLCQGLYHWAVVCGLNAPTPAGFESYETSYQVVTIFFAVIDLVAGVGLWLAAPWGAVIWLTSVISMAAVQVLFPQVLGGSIAIAVIELLLLGIYVFLALMAAREQPA